MFTYLLKRLLIFVPTFFIISVLIFGLSKLAPGDPVDLLLKGGTNAGNTGQRADLMAGELAYQEKAAQLGLDKPTFYLSLTSAAYPGDLYEIKKQSHRELLYRLIDLYGNADAAKAYYKALRRFEETAAGVVDTVGYNAKRTVRSAIGEVYLKHKDEDITFELNRIAEVMKTTAEYQSFKPQFDSLMGSYDYMKQNPTRYKLYLPAIRWYGMANQYHTWMFGDYPWLSSLDSTNHHKVASMTAEINVLGAERDSLADLFKKTKTKMLILSGEIASPLPESNLDSLRQVLAKATEDSSKLAVALEPLPAKIKGMSAERDSIRKGLVNYASKGFLRGDFGTSYLDSRPVSSKMGDALYWTLIMNFFSILISYLVSIPLGVKSATWKLQNRKTIDSFNTVILFVLYSLPSFWIGTILIVFFTSDEYGMNFFPTGGVQSVAIATAKDPDSIGNWTRFWDIAHHLALPIFCVTYGSFAYLSRQMRGSMLGTMRQDYIRTARAKGLSEGRVTWKHAFRNSLFPIITMFSSIFPRALAGSIAIEVIFNIPGMGKLVLESIVARDWPVVFTVAMLAAILTMIGNLVADMLYAVADPRVSFK